MSLQYHTVQIHGSASGSLYLGSEVENEPSERAAEVIDRWIGSQAKLKYLPGFTDPVQKEFVLPFPPEAAMQVGHNKTELFSKGLSGEQPVPLGTGTFQLLAVAWTVLEAEVIGQRAGKAGDAWWPMAEGESAVCPCGKADQLHSELSQQKCSQHTQGSEPSPLFGTRETMPGVLCSVWGSLVCRKGMDMWE